MNEGMNEWMTLNTAWETLDVFWPTDYDGDRICCQVVNMYDDTRYPVHVLYYIIVSMIMALSFISFFRIYVIAFVKKDNMHYCFNILSEWSG